MPESRQIWPPLPGAVSKVYGVAEVVVFQNRDEDGKPVLGLYFEGQRAIFVTANIAEMIGGVAIGARKRWEDFHR